MGIERTLSSPLLGSLVAPANDAREVDEIPGLKLTKSVTAVPGDLEDFEVTLKVKNEGDKLDESGVRPYALAETCASSVTTPETSPTTWDRDLIATSRSLGNA
jgi:hypothetical protein